LTRWCAQVPAVVEPPLPADAISRRVCADLIRHGDLLEWRHDARPGPHGALRLVQQLSGALRDEWDAVFIVWGEVPLALAEAASAWFERGTPGLGGAAPLAAGHLPRWRRLRSAVVLPSTAGLRAGPSLRGLAKAFGNRWSVPGCSPHAGGHWGPSDVGGQLGGGRLTPRGAGRYELGGGLVGNGANTTPYAPAELYLMGLLPLEQVPPITFLRGPTREADGAFRAEGTCRLTPSDLEARFGRRPPGPSEWRVGLVVIARQPLDAGEIARHQSDLAAFTAGGPDDDPWGLNFHEATAGHGHLIAHVPATRARACASFGGPPEEER
jgi:hypothetical protein